MLEIDGGHRKNRDKLPICCPFCGSLNIDVHPQLIEAKTGEIQEWMVVCNNNQCEVITPLPRPWERYVMGTGRPEDLHPLHSPEERVDGLACHPIKDTLRIIGMPQFSVQNTCVRWLCDANGWHQAGFQDLNDARDFHQYLWERAVDPMVVGEIVSNTPCNHRVKLSGILGYACMRPGAQGERLVHLDCDCQYRDPGEKK